MLEDRRERFPLGRVVATATAAATLDQNSILAAQRQLFLPGGE